MKMIINRSVTNLIWDLSLLLMALTMVIISYNEFNSAHCLWWLALLGGVDS
jgi:uncharacterized membrane protein